MSLLPQSRRRGIGGDLLARCQRSAVIGVIVGEFTASTAGLGLFINYASSTYDPAGVFAGIFVLLAFVMMMSAIASRIERRIMRWRPQADATPGEGT